MGPAMTPEEMERYRTRVFEAKSAEELEQLASDVLRDFPDDPAANGISEMAAQAAVLERLQRGGPAPESP